MRFLLSAILIALFCVGSAHGQGTGGSFYVPVLKGPPESHVGIAISNPNPVKAPVQLMARSYDGTILTGNGFPGFFGWDIPAHSQVSFLLEEVFGPALVNLDGYLEISSSVSNLTGFFVVFDSALSFMDGAAIQTKSSSRIYFPNVRFGGSSSTFLSIVNTTAAAPVPVSLSFYSSSGIEMLRVQRTLPAAGGLLEFVRDMTPSLPETDGYVVVNSANGHLIGFEMYKNTADFAAINALPESEFQTTGTISHFVSEGGYVTTLWLVNPTQSTQSVLLTAGALESSGTPRSQSTATVLRTLGPGAMLREDVASMFGLTGSDLTTGYLRWEVQGQTAGLIGGVDYGTADGRLMATVAGQGAGYTSLVFSHIAEGAGFYTGIVFFNPNSTPAAVRVESFSKDGASTGTATVNLPPGGRIARLVREVIPSAGQQVGGYILVSSAVPVFAYELFGSSDSPRILANVPADSVQPAQQASDTIVESRSGAVVLADGGDATLTVPSGALQTNAAITLLVVNAGVLPDPDPGHALIAAVKALPAGTMLAIPALLRFPLSVSLPPGTKIPVLTYTAGAYSASEFTAIVDETGNHAVAGVTRLASFALAIDRQAIPPETPTAPPAITSLSPAIGLTGDSIVVHGSGFSLVPSGNDVRFAGANQARIGAAVLFAGPTSLTVVVPNEAVQGAVTVKVGGATSNGMPFDPNEPAITPQITSWNPSGVSIYVDSATIEITGVGFRPDSIVLFDGESVPFSYLNRTRLNVPWTRSGPFTETPHKLKVSNGNAGESNSVDFTTNLVPLPSISSISPSSVPSDVPTEVTVRGDGFIGATLVMFSNGYTIQGTLIDRTTYRFTTPVFFPGTYQVRVSQSFTNSQSSSVPLTFVAPPAHTPTRIALGYSRTVTAGASMLIAAALFDAYQVVPTATNPVTLTISLPGGAEVLRETGTPVKGTASFNFTPSQEGQYDIRATADGLQSSTGSFQAVENVSLTIVSGNNQSGLVGSALPVPLKVRLTNAGGQPLAGRTVSFTDPLFATLVPKTTDASGEAEYQPVFPTQAGAKTVKATHLNAGVTFALQVIPGPPVRTGFSPSNGPLRLGQTRSFLVAVSDQYGNLSDVNMGLVQYHSSMPGEFTFSSPPEGSLLAVTYRSTTPGKHTLTFQYPGTASASADFTFLPENVPARIAIVSGDNQNAKVGTTLPQLLRVILTDASNKPVAGGLVRFTASFPSTFDGSDDLVDVYTNDQGIAETIATLAGSQAGKRLFKAGFYRGQTDFFSVTFTATATP